jgi:hypothetical protein
MSTIKADSVQPTIAGNNLILKSGSGDVERVRISPTGQITFASTTGTTFSGDVNFANATRFPGGIGAGGGFAGTPYTALDVVHTNASLLDPGVNNYNSTRGRSNLSIRGSGTNTTLFLGNAADAAVWLQAQNSDNNQKAISLNPVGGFVGIGTTGPTVALDVSGAIKASVFSSGNIAPIPSTSAGIGNIVTIQATSGSNYTLSSGGTWFYWAFQWDTSQVRDVTSGIASGGSTVLTGTSGRAWYGFAWRIT